MQYTTLIYDMTISLKSNYKKSWVYANLIEKIKNTITEVEKNSKA